MIYEEALQNPDFKKIWEEVIRNKYPEAKSLEEALELESLTDGCLCSYKKRIDYYRLISNINNKKFIKILGRPITLEDILILLDGKAEYCGIEDGYHIFGYRFLERTTHTHIAFSEYFRLKARTEFDEQTPETWKAIAEII